MSDRERIVSGVARLRRRRRLQLAFDWAFRGLLYGTLAAALVILAGKVWLLPIDPVWTAVTVVALAVIGCAGFALLRPPTTLAVANEIDVRLGLRERVSSALALGIEDSTKKEINRDPFVKALVHDAAKVVEKAELKRVFPWQMPRTWRLAAVALLLAGGLSFLPQFNWVVKQSDRAEAKQVQNEGEKLKELAKQLKKDAEKKKDPVLKQQAREVKRTGEKLDKPSVKKKEALKELKKLEDKIKEQQSAQTPEGEKQLTAELGKQLEQMKSTQDLGKLLSEGKTPEFTQALKDMLANLQSGKMSPEQQQQMKDLLQALDQTLKSQSASKSDAQELKQQLEQMKQALQSAQDAKSQLGQTLQSLQKDVAQLSQQLKQGQLGQQSQQLNQLMQQMQQQFAKDGKLDQKTIDQMHEALKQAQSQCQNSQKMSSQQKQGACKQCQQCLNYFEGQQGQQGKDSKSGQPGQGGQLSQMNDQLAQQMAQMGQQCQKAGQCMGGQCKGGAGGSLSAQIAAIQQSLGQGQYLSQTQGQAGSGWGMGSTPYAAAPKEAPGAHPESHQGKAQQNGVQPEQYTGMYAPNDYAHSAHDERIKGNIDFTKAPEKIEEVRSAPEDQKALREYSGAVSAYADGEEEAVSREQVPLEYQELVRKYFEEIKKGSKKK